MPLPSLGSAVLAAIVLAGPARAADRPYASNTWVQVQDDALLCSRPDGQGQCARFRLPGVEVASGQGPRVFRVVARHGAEVELQAQYSPEHESCGILPARITPLLLRVFVSESAVTEIDEAAPCVLPGAGDMPGPGVDPALLAQRVALVRAGARVTWLDGSLAAVPRDEVWLLEAHGPTLEGRRVCATFDLGPDDGGAADHRAFDLCVARGDLRWDP